MIDSIVTMTKVPASWTRNDSYGALRNSLRKTQSGSGFLNGPACLSPLVAELCNTQGSWMGF